MSKHPLGILALAACAGILLAEVVGSVGLWVVVATAVLLSCWWAPRLSALLLAVMCCYGVKHKLQLLRADEHPLRVAMAADQRLWAKVEGYFEAVPPDAEGGGGGVVLGFCADKIVFPSGAAGCVGQTRLKAWFKGGGAQPPRKGGRYLLKGYVMLSPPGRNPSLFRPEDSALRQGIIGRMTVEECVLLKAADWDLRLRSLQAAEWCRRKIAGYLSYSIEEEKDVVGFLQLMTLGASELETHHLEDEFRDTGTLHIFSVSGLHVGMIALIMWRMLGLLRCPRKTALCIIAPLLLGYAFLSGWQAAAARSGVMAVVMLLAPVFCRQASMLNALGGSALLLLGVDTQQLFAPGFQLSFFIVWALVVGSAWIVSPLRWWTELDSFLPESVATPVQLRWRGLRRWLVNGVASSTAAWCGSLPLMMYHFHSVTPVALLANLVEVPLSFMALLTAALTILCGLAGFSYGQMLLNHANLFWAKGMIWTAGVFSCVPGGNVTWGPSLPLWSAETQLCVLSLPAGHAAQVLAKGERCWMLDCGSESDATRTVLPFLRYQGVSRLEGVVLSHADSDHVGAAQLLDKRMSVGGFYAAVGEPWLLDTRQTSLWRLHSWLGESGRGLHSLSAGEKVRLGPASGLVMYPQVDDRAMKADDRCMVLQLQLGRGRVMLCGDVGLVAEDALLERWFPVELRSEVLVWDQHGSDTCFTKGFLKAVAPRYLITPAPASMARASLLQELGIKELNPGKEGMITLSEDVAGLRLQSWVTGLDLRVPAHGR